MDKEEVCFDKGGYFHLVFYRLWNIKDSKYIEKEPLEMLFIVFVINLGIFL